MGAIDGVTFSNNCAPAPRSTLARHQPLSAWVVTYISLYIALYPLLGVWHVVCCAEADLPGFRGTREIKHRLKT